MRFALSASLESVLACFAQGTRVVALMALSSLIHLTAIGAEVPDDPALNPPRLITSPSGPYADEARRFQGIPGIERAPGGRLWATWYGGGEDEGPDNYCMLATSGDDGATWSNVKLIVESDGDVRTFDPCLWMDTEGRLWFFWAQGYSHWDGRAGVWAMTTGRPDSENPDWTPPRRLCDGIMMNKPTVLSTGEWLLPAAIWAFQPNVIDNARAHDIAATTGSMAVGSTDKGATWSLFGKSNVDGRACDEHMFVERPDGTVWMLVRTSYGIGECFSSDKGRSWTQGQPSAIKHIPSARFFIRKMASGRLLLVKHAPPEGKARSHLTAFLSDNEGATWQGGLMLDERAGVSYPDGVEGPDGRIYVIYDYSRRGDKQILMAVFTEDDVLRGECVSDGARLQVLVNQAGAASQSKKSEQDGGLP